MTLCAEVSRGLSTLAVSRCQPLSAQARCGHYRRACRPQAWAGSSATSTTTRLAVGCAGVKTNDDRSVTAASGETSAERRAQPRDNPQPAAPDRRRQHQGGDWPAAPRAPAPGRATRRHRPTPPRSAPPRRASAPHHARPLRPRPPQSPPRAPRPAPSTPTRA